LKCFGVRIGIDMGGAKTVVARDGEVLLSEPSLVIYGKDGEEPLGTGLEAWRMLAELPVEYRCFWPVSKGRVLNAGAASALLRGLMKKALPRSGIFTYKSAVVCVPCGVSAEEKAALSYALKSAGVSRCMFCLTASAALYCEGKDIFEPRGRLLIDAGKTGSAAAVTLTGAAAFSDFPFGAALDREIAGYSLKQRGVRIGLALAEALKLGRQQRVPGIEEQSCALQYFEPSSGELDALFEKARERACEAAAEVMRSVSPDLLSDIAEEGIYLFGGGSFLPGLREKLSECTGLRAERVEDALYGGARGASLLVEYL